MNLRLRLIVVFFLLSVVPLGAVTYYTYANNLKAVRDAAGHEAQTLAGELSQRMQLVTAQLSLRVGRLMDVSMAHQEAAAAAAPAAVDVVRTAGADASDELPAGQAAAADSLRIGADEAGDALGETAMLLDKVVLVGGPRRGGSGGRRGGPPRDGVDTPGERGGGSPPSSAAGNDTPRLRPGPSAGGPGGRNPNGRGREGTPDGNREAPGRRGGPPPVDPSPDPDSIQIDLGPIWREVVEQIVPGGRVGELSGEDRQRVFAEVNQRMMGVRQGIEMLQQAVADRAAGTRVQSEAARAGSKTEASPPTAPVAPTAPVPATVPGAPTPSPAQPAIQRRAALSGNRLDVSFERDGEVVSRANAEVNLRNLVATVFTNARRESGEVPFAVAPDGRIYASSDADREMVKSIGSTAVEPNAAPGTTVSPEWIVATTPDPTGSELKFGVARPLGNALDELQRTTARNAAFGLGFIALALVGIVPLASGMTRNLSKLNDAVLRLAHGDYSARAEVKANDEVGRLARAFNQMAADVEGHRRSAVEQERIRRELELGRQIQHDMLPQSPLRLGLTEVKGVSVPAREVGGDFFNYFQLQDGTVALLVGDVSGKGVGAALLMANIQAALRTRLSLGQDLASLAQELDLDIERSTPGPVYATLFVGIFEPRTRTLRCVNAGHNPQYVLRGDRGLERMESTGRPIGLFAGGGYAEQVVNLSAGDVLFFYTDGCVEAENASGDMFGPERLEGTLAACAGRDADEVLVAVETEVSRFRAGIELQDDATMMVVKVG